MVKRYGLPYMGSKSSIAPWVLSFLPPADNFYDLFCGGCSITHCAIESKRYRNFYINDIKKELPQGFLDCVRGKYKDDYRWISHDDFDKMKGQGDMLVDLCFSFGNNWLKGYAYSREIEPLKKALHEAVCFGDTIRLSGLLGKPVPNLHELNDKYVRMNAIKRMIGQFATNMPQHLLSLDRLQSLERLQRLEELAYRDTSKIANNIFTSGKSYDEVLVKENSVIYCDIPYRATSKYDGADFDYEGFYDWCLRQTQPLFISEYDMPKDDFVCIAARRKQVLMCAKDNSKQAIEKIFIPKHQINNKPLTLF